MIKKRKLSDLVHEETHRPEPEPKLIEPAESEPKQDELPKYLTLIRKEARLTELQLEQLTNLARKLNRRRRGDGERITENTLIRVAIDLLLKRSNELNGTTEAELREALGLESRD